MYKVVVLAHNLREPEMDPVEFSKHTDESLLLLLAQATHDIENSRERGGLKSRSLAIEISEVNKDGSAI